MPFSGEVTRKRNYKRRPAGEVTFTGNVGTGSFRSRSVGGVITFVGNITSLAYQRLLEGSISFSGSVTRIINGIPVSSGVKKFLDIGAIGINFVKGFFSIGR